MIRRRVCSFMNLSIVDVHRPRVLAIWDYSDSQIDAVDAVFQFLKLFLKMLHRKFLLETKNLNFSTDYVLLGNVHKPLSANLRLSIVYFDELCNLMCKWKVS